MNWVGGVRNRLKSSLQNEKKAQKVYFERKQQERSESASASRNLNEVKISRRNGKHNVSQDILSFKMQREMNYKTDGKSCGNFRVVNLGPTKRGPSTKNGANVLNTGRVESVNLPVSPIETPSALDLSSSPIGNDLLKYASQDRTEQYVKSHAQHNRLIDDKRILHDKHATGSSNLIHLFGMPVEKPVKNQRPVSSSESRHNYSVSSDRACRKSSCTETPCKAVSVISDLDTHVSTQMSSSTDSHTNQRNLEQNDVERFTFTKPAILNNKSGTGFTFSPNYPNNDTVTCCSEPPVFSYSSTGLNCDKWRDISDTDYHTLQEAQYISTFPDVPSMPVSDISNTTFTMDKNMNSFEVNLVSSPWYGQHKDILGDNSTKYNNKNQFYHMKQHTDVCERASFSDSLIPNDTEFYEEVNENARDELTFIPSPHSPPKSVFLPQDTYCYSPPGMRNSLSKSCEYVSGHDSIPREFRTDEFGYRQYHEPMQLLNQRGSDPIEIYNSASGISTVENITVDSGVDNIHVLYDDRQTYRCGFQNQDTIVNAMDEDQPSSHGKDTYLVSSGLDCTPTAKHVYHSREKLGVNMSSFDWRQSLRSRHYETDNEEMRTSNVSSCAGNREVSYRPKKPIYFGTNDEQSVACNEVTTSSSMHRPFPATDETYPMDIQNKETGMNEHKINETRDTESLSATPLMTSTPQDPQIKYINNKRSNQLVWNNQNSNIRENRKTNSSNEGLLESSISDTANLHTHFQEPRNNKLPVADTTLSTHDQTAGKPIPVTTSKNNSMTEICTSRDAENMTLYTPAHSISSTKTRTKSPPSANLIRNWTTSVTDNKNKLGNSCTQNNTDEVTTTCEVSIDSESPEHRDSSYILVNKLSTDTIDKSIQGEISSALVGKTCIERKCKISTSTQTTPKLVQDAACSPIKVFSMEGPPRQSEQSSTHIGKIYCLRSRNKIE